VKDLTVPLRLADLAPEFFAGGGEMGARMRTQDWATTPLGCAQEWPQSLRTAVSIMLNSRHPMFLAWGAELAFLYNDGYIPIFGARHPHTLGRPFAEIWAEIWDDVGPLVERALAGEATWAEDMHLVMQRNGYPEDTWYTFSYSPIRDESGGIGGMFCACTETTAKVLAERRLKSQLEQLRQLFRQAPGFMAVLRGPQHVFEFANEAYLRLVGDRELVGLPVREALPDIAGQGFFKQLDHVYATAEPVFAQEAPVTLQRKPGAGSEERFVDFIFQPVMEAGGAISGILIEGYDVTERRHANKALRESEARLRLALQAARMSEVTFFPAVGEVSHSRGYAALLGFDPDRILTMAEIRDLYHPDDLERVMRERAAILAGEDTFYDIEHRIIRPDGTVRWIYGRGEVQRGSIGIPVSVTAVYIDVTEQREAQERLSESEAQFRTFAQAMPNHVWAALANGRLNWFNDRVYHYTGFAAGDLDGENWRRVIHPEDECRALAAWTAALASGSDYEVEFRIRRADGAYRWHLARALPIRDGHARVTRWIGTNTDIEDQKAATAQLSVLNATLESRVEQRSKELRAAEEALRHAQKMEAVGQLTGGIAHDFNNLLTGIIGSLDIVRRRFAKGRLGDVDRFIDAAVTSANRAAGLTHRLLAFSRRQSLDAKPIEVNRLVASMEDLLRRTLSENVAVTMTLDADLWMAEADANQLESALLNLVINARDAMPDGGTLTVATSNTRLDVNYTSEQEEGLEPGDYVVMCVSDTGTGMPQSVLERAFDPFFTTKPIGQGTGLGLSMIYGFAKQSRGHARIDSEVGKGTTVKLYLPRFRGEADAADEIVAVDAPRARAGETVLIVEDDSAVRMLVVEVLRELGYAFIEAVDATAATTVLQSSQRIDLLISDVGLPGMNGRQLAEMARELRADLRVLFVTGYAENAAVRGGFLEPGMEMITKPFALDALAGKIREMLLIE
jgi:PAS domain S-box-containing protein